MVESPAPLMSHSLAGLPGLQFSATISLAGEAQGPLWSSGTDEMASAVLVAGDGSAMLLRAAPSSINALVAANTIEVSTTKTSAAKRARTQRMLISSLAVRSATAERRRGIFLTVNVLSRCAHLCLRRVDASLWSAAKLGLCREGSRISEALLIGINNQLETSCDA